ncbi:AraC family transcriptional regulator N-terminal domain-containing protein [Celerinatantimonas sp. YJH-8]|uniref:AraC family transcriptional regulator n=1 Tax=Celerinatantimonas sp. YJH-8 TaxID=3228714 RepID=UPI0038C873EB
MKTNLPDVHVFRRNTPTSPQHCVIPPSIVVVVQGEKQMYANDKIFTYNASHFLLSSIELPASSEVVEASPDKPCLGIVVPLDMKLISDILLESDIQFAIEEHVEGCITIGQQSIGILKSLLHLLELADEPETITQLAPLFMRELHYRLLLSDQAVKLKQMVLQRTQADKIAKTIEFIKFNYMRPIRVSDLASSVQMSPQTFHHHFRGITDMSPLQYQKWLRLTEAKRLMLNQHLGVAKAAYQVGYESVSQFSREYSRMFGASPKKDLSNSQTRVKSAG